MSEQDKTEGASAPAANEEIKNLKSEMSRKFSNLEATNAALKAQLEAMSAKPAAPASNKKLSDTLFEDTEGFVATVVDNVSKQVDAKLSAQAAQQAKYNKYVAPLYTKYPELNDPNSGLMQKAQEIYASLPDEEKNSVVAMKAAVTEAAMELGVKVKGAKASESSDEEAFTVNGSGKQSKQAKGAPDIDPATEALGRMLSKHINMDDPKVRERLKNNHGRKSYKRYE